MGTNAANTERPWSAADILTVTKATARLGIRRQAAAAWLRQQVPIFLVAGQERVRWGDVLDAIAACPVANAAELTPRASGDSTPTPPTASSRRRSSARTPRSREMDDQLKAGAAWLDE